MALFFVIPLKTYPRENEKRDSVILSPFSESRVEVRDDVAFTGMIKISNSRSVFSGAPGQSLF